MTSGPRERGPVFVTPRTAFSGTLPEKACGQPVIDLEISPSTSPLSRAAPRGGAARGLELRLPVL